MTKTQFIIIAAVGLIVLVFLLGVMGVIPLFKQGNQNGPIETTISFWGIDDPIFFRDIIDSYTSTHTGLKIAYRQFKEEDFENAILNAMATGKGPDILMFHRSWVAKHGDKIVATPDSQFSLFNLRQMFPDVIETDFGFNQKVYALPLYLDTLAMLYNKDIFNAKNVALVPTTWEDLKNIVPVLVNFDFSRQIKKAGAAIGGSDISINKASDLITTLFLQFNPSFKSKKEKPLSFESESVKALNFYLQFSNSSSDYYTWSEDFTNNSVDAFASGNAAIIFNYNRAIPKIKEKNPYLNFSVAPLPQVNPGQPVNFADYWGVAVSKQSKQQTQSWNFIISLTTNSQILASYLKESHRPPALRTLINQNLKDVDLGVFAKQSLTAKSVYQKDNIAFKKTISNMIESILTGKTDVSTAMRQANAEINEL